MGVRRFFSSIDAISRRAVLARGAALFSALPWVQAMADAADAPPLRAGRESDAYRMRVAAAAFEREQHWSAGAANGDETAYPGYVASYSKALPHNRIGEVHPQAYELMLRALRSGDPRDFEFIPRVGEARLTNPQGGFTFNLIGPDPSAVGCPPAPRFSSAEQAAEMIELYWQALARDVPFARYDSHPLIARAAAELGRLRDAGAVMHGSGEGLRTLFRGRSAGSLAGPYISQFLWKEIFYAPMPLEQRIHSAPPGRDYLDRYDAWLDVQNGVPTGPLQLDALPCYVRCGRDLAEYVHRDFSYQAPLSAGLILLKMGAPPNRGNPYFESRDQSGFATFGAPYLLYLLATATHVALTACWYQKWLVHRRIRPEEFGGRLANFLTGKAVYPFHETLLHSDALAETLRAQSSALLTSSYPEGAPTHPAYPAGHAVISAAGTTVLKAFFDETFVVPDPVEALADGLSLKPYEGAPLTVGGELDKLATNIGMGRCFAGIHWRSDIEAGLRLGEEVAIAVLRELRLTSHEPFSGFRFHRLDGKPVAA